MSVTSDGAPESKRRKLHTSEEDHSQENISRTNSSSGQDKIKLESTLPGTITKRESTPHNEDDAASEIANASSKREKLSVELTGQSSPTRRGPGRPRKHRPINASKDVESIPTQSGRASKRRSSSIVSPAQIPKTAPFLSEKAETSSTSGKVRRRSERVREPVQDSRNEVVSTQQQPKISSLAPEAVDTRRRHANGKPMGRPRKSDLNQKVKTDLPSQLGIAVDKGQQLVIKQENGLDIQDLKDTRKKSASGKPLGRPRKSDLKQEQLRDMTLTGELVRENGVTSQNKSFRVSPRTATANAAYSGPKKIKLRFGLHPAQAIITHPAHVPLQRRHTSFSEYLQSFVSLEEDVSPKVAQERRGRLQETRREIARARQEGVLDVLEKPRISTVRPMEPEIPQNHQDFFCGQARYFSKLMQDERRRNHGNARKIAGMIQAHFKKLQGADERQSQESQRAVRQLAKRTANEVKRKWRLAEKEVQRRLDLKLQEEQRAAGKEHLNQILEHSTNLLDAQMSSKIDDEAFLDNVSEGNEDHYLSVEELREKYANLPEVSTSFAAESDSDQSEEGDEDEKLGEDHVEAQTDVEPDPVEAAYLAHKKILSSVTNGDPSGSNDVEIDSLPSDESSNDSPMDSELETSDQESVEDTDDSDAPGLAFLYPELRQQHGTQESSTVFDIADTDLPHKPVNTISAVIPEDSMLSSRPRTSRATSDVLVALPSDESDKGESPDDSPMDSELDESDAERDGAESEVESEDGPGLSWLYATPIQKQQQDEPSPIQHETESPQRTVTSSGELDAQDTIANAIKTPVPFLLRGVLREYQHIGLDWMAGLYLNGTNGILADEMGLGKTIQTISLIAWLACEREVWGPHLIVVPTSVMLNWEREFKKFLPALKVLTYYGTPKERKEKRKGWSRPDTVHVVITSYQLVITDAAVFRRKYWEYMILDEAHNIKNFKSQRWQTLLNFNTAHRLLLTGTPLQNNLNELWSLLYFLMPQGLSENASFANLADFQEWFARPVDKLIEQGNAMVNDEARHTIAKLHRILRPYILRRLKADVEKQMPGKFEHVITCRLSKRQRYLYDDFMARSGTRTIMASGNFLSIINCFMQLRKVCNHPDLFESRPIVTSLATRRSVVAHFEVQELLVRRRLLRKDYSTKVNVDCLNLNVVRLEGLSKPVAVRISELSTPIEILSSSYDLRPVKLQSADATKTALAQKASSLHNSRDAARQSRTAHQNYISAFRCDRVPVYGSSFVQFVAGATTAQARCSSYWYTTPAIEDMCPTIQTVANHFRPVIARFACVTPKAITLDLEKHMVPLPDHYKAQLRFDSQDASYFARVSTAIAFPDKRLLQFDCGKLQRLDTLLKELIAGDHRVLIFTQMTKMLDILEQFLNIHGYRYFRLDGSTKIEARQSLTERFNTDRRIPVFILSTRSGGLGINLTGADTVIFYDSDWNPCMDRQCQDRAHRIGQTRDVHIYRFVSEYTIEQNIMRKANQKRMLDNVVIGEGDFTTDFFNKVDWRDMLGDELSATVTQSDGIDVQKALAAAEDEDDARAAAIAEKEMDIDAVEFAETGKTARDSGVQKSVRTEEEAGEEEEEEEAEMGSVDDYMINFLARELNLTI